MHLNIFNFLYTNKSHPKTSQSDKKKTTGPQQQAKCNSSQEKLPSGKKTESRSRLQTAVICLCDQLGGILYITDLKKVEGVKIKH